MNTTSARCRRRCGAETPRRSRRSGPTPGPPGWRRARGGRGCARCRSGRRTVCASVILDSQRSSESFLCPISWAVLMPTPPSTPTDSATPILPNQPSPPVEAEPAQVRGGEQVGAQHHAGVLERDVDVGAVAVVLVVLQPLHRLVGRVLPVGAEAQVQHRQQDVEQDRPDPQRHLRRDVPAELVDAPDNGSITNSAVGAISPISHR